MYFRKKNLHITLIIIIPLSFLPLVKLFSIYIDIHCIESRRLRSNSNFNMSFKCKCELYIHYFLMFNKNLLQKVIILAVRQLQ